MINNLFYREVFSNKLFKLEDNKIDNILLTSELVEKSASENMGDDLFLNGIKANYLLINFCSFNPDLNGSKVILSENKELFKLGLDKLKASLNVKNVKFIVNKKDKELISDISDLGEVVKVNPMLCSDDEKVYKKSFGKAVSKDEVLALDLVDIIYYGQRLKESENILYITIYGSAVKANKVFAAYNGTSLLDIFNSLSGDSTSLKKIIINGSISGKSEYNLSFKINKETKSILFLTEDDSPSREASSCIRCAKCLRICPKGLNPIKLMELYKRNEKDEFSKFGGDNCIECGLCSFICPSNIEVAQTIKTAKAFNNK
ncbi:4Fe-4S dicluster domain-containing protein [Clostridium sp.]|uniref:4Fe-4S dicluster domain-containing protein n=1 Tax=Clostridium sp. TaxID=1506 RepID=UPI003F3419B8